MAFLVLYDNSKLCDKFNRRADELLSMRHMFEDLPLPPDNDIDIEEKKTKKKDGVLN